MAGAAALPKELPAKHSAEKGLVRTHPIPAQVHCGLVSMLCPHQVLTTHKDFSAEQHTALGKPLQRLSASASAPPTEGPTEEIVHFQEQSEGWRVPGHIHLQSVCVEDRDCLSCCCHI